MNAVIFWNSVLLEANRRDFTRGFPNGQNPGPIATTRAMAIVHIAIHDAIAQKTKPAAAYLPVWSPGTVLPPVTGTVLVDVIAGAAATAIKAVYPKSAGLVDGLIGAVDALSFNDGAAIANAVLTARTVDGSGGDLTTPSQKNPIYGDHRADPFDPGQRQLGATWGMVLRFTNVGHKPLAAYPGHANRPIKAFLADSHYHQDFVEVRDQGGLNAPARTPEQQRIGTYWGYDGANELGVPPRLYNQMLQKLAIDKGLNLAKCADLFAIANIAMADSGIDAWHYKYFYKLWRPVVGIRNEVVPAEDDPFWVPLGAPQTNASKVGQTPPFPAYPSGHATFGSAIFQVMRLFLATAPGKITLADVLAHDKTVPAPPTIGPEEFDFVSDELDGAARDADGSVRTRVSVHFSSFSRAVWENAVSRVYLGVHWRFDGLPRKAADNIGGVPLGLDIGEEAFTYFKSNNLLVG